MRALGCGRAVQPLLDEVDEARDVRGVHPGRARAGEGQAGFICRLLRLVVEIPEHLHVVAHEPERHHGHRLDALGGQVGDDVVDVRLEPRLRRRTRARLKHERPVDVGGARELVGEARHEVLRHGTVLRGIRAALAEVAVARAGSLGVGHRNRVRREQHPDLARGQPRLEPGGHRVGARPRRTARRSPGGRRRGAPCRSSSDRRPRRGPCRIRFPARARSPRGTGGRSSTSCTRWWRSRAPCGGRPHTRS